MGVLVWLLSSNINSHPPESVHSTFKEVMMVSRPNAFLHGTLILNFKLFLSAYITYYSNLKVINQLLSQVCWLFNALI